MLIADAAGASWYRIKLAICLIAGALAGGGTAVALLGHEPASTQRTGLAPEASSVRYRFAAAIARDDTNATIAALEARVKEMRSPFDLGELAELYLRRAQRDGDADDYRRAEDAAQRSLAVLRAPNGAVLTLAKLAATRHQFREAIALAQEQLGHKRSAAPYAVMATAHLALGELAAATEAANAALALEPDSGSYLTRALVLAAQGRDGEAAYDFARAASLEQFGDPQGAARLRALWARFLLRRGELVGARELLAEALRIVPEYPLALAYQGELALREGRPEKARAQLEQAFAASRQVRYLIEQARAQEVTGDRDGADITRAQVEQIVRAELVEGGLGHRLDLVEVLVDRGAHLAEAVALAREEVARRPGADARFQLARALARTGKLDDALAQLQAALDTGARDARLFELAAELEQQRGDATRAELFHADAERLDPGGAGLRYAGAGAGAGAP